MKSRDQVLIEPLRPPDSGEQAVPGWSSHCNPSSRGGRHHGLHGVLALRLWVAGFEVMRSFTKNGRRQMKRVLIALGLMVTLAAPSFGREKALPDVTFPDGATGTVTAECGVADLCASLKLPGGDSIEVYNEGGAGYCQPYMLSIIRLRGTTVLLKSETESASKKVKEGMQKFTCAQFLSTYLTFDAGIAKLGLFLSKDGTLFGEWSISKSDTAPTK